MRGRRGSNRERERERGGFRLGSKGMANDRGTISCSISEICVFFKGLGGKERWDIMIPGMTHGHMVGVRRYRLGYEQHQYYNTSGIAPIHCIKDSRNIGR